jgi:phytoene dehydrogenase-like protein
MGGYQVIIIGGGLGGLAAAISLRRAGQKVTVLERTESFANVGLTILSV